MKTPAAIRVDRFEDYLREHNLSRTAPRRALYTVLAADGPGTPPALVAALSAQMDRATVYRTIEFFLANRIAVRAGATIELGDAFRPHHHHLVCSDCGRSESIDDQTLEAAVGKIAALHGFTLENHQVELEGRCADCRARR